MFRDNVSKNSNLKEIFYFNAFKKHLKTNLIVNTGSQSNGCTEHVETCHKLVTKPSRDELCIKIHCSASSWQQHLPYFSM